MSWSWLSSASTFIPLGTKVQVAIFAESALSEKPITRLVAFCGWLSTVRAALLTLKPFQSISRVFDDIETVLLLVALALSRILLPLTLLLLVSVIWLACALDENRQAVVRATMAQVERVSG
ncbi:hypothetical protein VCRA2120O333_40260 [Vibrio crassostreae]|nr:hypothetical protein VCRA2113O323_20367 [Vibrio crassostreae]CAK2857147.1 hypothetical protein VCRA2113O325_20369 [Vibrio crassostreae]CAK3560819.1 hypothetical protein VCRA2120O332_30206 [Vibrio crassostreae]CAK3926207.1 hypothetical protein VCRA2120O333_40260 [Vibrio crassostreae]